MHRAKPNFFLRMSLWGSSVRPACSCLLSIHNTQKETLFWGSSPGWGSSYRPSSCALCYAPFTEVECAGQAKQPSWSLQLRWCYYHLCYQNIYVKVALVFVVLPAGPVPRQTLSDYQPSWGKRGGWNGCERYRAALWPYGYTLHHALITEQ